MHFLSNLFLSGQIHVFVLIQSEFSDSPVKRIAICSKRVALDMTSFHPGFCLHTPSLYILSPSLLHFSTCVCNGILIIFVICLDLSKSDDDDDDDEDDDMEDNEE